MCIQPCHGASNDFAKLLDNLVGGPNGRLRVLITSLYPPQRCDPKWAGGFEDDEEGLKSLGRMRICESIGLGDRVFQHFFGQDSRSAKFRIYSQRFLQAHTLCTYLHLLNSLSW